VALRALALLLLAVPAVAQDVAELAAQAAAREEATFPFAVDYRVGTIAAKYACRGSARTWRTDGEIWMRFDRWWLHARHEPDASYTRWRGTMDRTIHFPVAPIPAQLGLEHDLRLCSEYLRHESARVVREERLGAFPCVVVLVDWLVENGTEILHPMGLWLSTEHGAYPVQLIVYERDADPDADHPGRITLPDGVFAPRLRCRVEELAAAGGAWFPLRGTVAVDGMETELVMDEATLRLGDDVTDDDLDPPSFMWIRDLARGGFRWFTPLGSIPFSFLWVVWYVANVVVMVWLIRFLARRRRRTRRGSSRPKTPGGSGPSS
jgi:hypothetical protein